MEKDGYILWLSKLPGLGRKKISALLEYFDSPEQIFQATKLELLQVEGIFPMDADCIVRTWNEEKAEEEYHALLDRGISYLSILNENYPYLLKQIYDPPCGIYVRGSLPDAEIEMVSIVGARRCSEYGARVAYQIGRDLAKHNIAIVSGMARGIDSMAHKGAIAGGGKTVAVLGSGVDICYPPENRGLMEKIIQNGCVVSEYPPQTGAMARNFPQRNRIISGLTKIVVVVEAGKRSGTLITANQALDNGRDVFVVPGNITSPLSEGTNNLIKEGCAVVTEVNDILFELGIGFTEEKKDNYIKNNLGALENNEKRVYDCINSAPAAIDEIAQRVEEPIQTVQYILTMLELKGYIRQLPGARYVRVDHL